MSHNLSTMDNGPYRHNKVIWAVSSGAVAAAVPMTIGGERRALPMTLSL